MKIHSQGLFWKRSGWPPVVAVGALAAILSVGLSLEKGFQAGYVRGIQTVETGQVQIESAHGGIAPYFLLRVLSERLPGVVASSARLDFTAQVTNSMGTVRAVHVRACDFVDEGRVTNLLSRLDLGGRPPVSGIVLSRELAGDPEWNREPFLRVSSPEGKFESQSVSVSSQVEGSAGSELDQLVYMDLGTAQRLWGANVAMSSIALRLEPGTDPTTWARDHEDVFHGFGMVVKPWREVSDPQRPSSLDVLGSFDVLLNVVMLMASLGIILVGFESRRARSGLFLLLHGGRTGRWTATAFLAGSYLATSSFLVLTGPAYQELFLRTLRDEFPFVGSPSLLWAWDVSNLGIPVLVVGVGLLVFLWPRTALRHWTRPFRTK